MTARKQAIGLAIASWLVPVFAGPGLAADAPATAPPAVSAQEQIHRYGASNPRCSEWTDGCVVCTKDGCSNIGIACQPKEITCQDKPPKSEK